MSTVGKVVEVPAPIEAFLFGTHRRPVAIADKVGIESRLISLQPLETGSTSATVP